MVTIDQGQCSDFSTRLIRFQDDFHQKYQKKRSITEIFLYYVGGALVTIGVSALLHAEAVYNIAIQCISIAQQFLAKGRIGSLQNYEWSKTACEASWKSLKSLLDKSCLPQFKENTMAPLPEYLEKEGQNGADAQSIGEDSITPSMIDTFPLFAINSESSQQEERRSPSGLSDHSFVDVGRTGIDSAERKYTSEEIQLELQAETMRAKKEFENINCPFLAGISEIGILSSFETQVQGHKIKGVHNYGENIQTFIAGSLSGYPCVAMINPRSDVDSYVFLEKNLINQLDERFKEMNSPGLSLDGIWNAFHGAVIDLHEEFIESYPQNDGCFITIAVIINRDLWVISAGNSKAVICTPTQQIYGIAANASIFGYSAPSFDPKIARFDLDAIPDKSYVIMMNNEAFFPFSNKLNSLTNDQGLDMAAIIVRSAAKSDPENPMSCLAMSLTRCTALDEEQPESGRGSFSDWENVENSSDDRKSQSCGR